MLNNIKKFTINSKLKFLLLLPVFNQYSMDMSYNEEKDLTTTNLEYLYLIENILLCITLEIEKGILYVNSEIRTDTIKKVTTLIVKIVNNYKEKSLEIITVFFINLYNTRYEKTMCCNHICHKYGKKNIFEMLWLNNYEFFCNSTKEKKEKKKILIDLIIVFMKNYFNLNNENINVIGNTIFNNQFNNKEEFDKKYADFIKDIYNNPKEEAMKMKKMMDTCYMIYSEFSDLKKDTILQINEKEIEIKIEKEKEKYDKFLNELRDSYYIKQELEKNKF